MILQICFVWYYQDTLEHYIWLRKDSSCSCSSTCCLHTFRDAQGQRVSRSKEKAKGQEHGSGREVKEAKTRGIALQLQQATHHWVSFRAAYVCMRGVNQELRLMTCVLGQQSRRGLLRQRNDSELHMCPNDVYLLSRLIGRTSSHHFIYNRRT
jgi:hypothetical protein